MKLAILFLQLLLTVPCKRIAFVDGHALRGENVRRVYPNEFPYVTALLTFKNYNATASYMRRFCAGTLISNQKVLTAAHCLDDMDLSRVRLNFGSDDMRLGVKIGIRWKLTYKEWAAHRRVDVVFDFHDVAVLKLSASIPDYIEPAGISTLSHAELIGLNVSIAGWGQANNGQVPFIMETAQLTVLSKVECEERVQRLQGPEIMVHDGLLCTASDPFVFLSSGDSGGPILYDNKIVGVNSGTTLRRSGADEDKMNVHSGIFYYKDFILDTLLHFN